MTGDIFCDQLKEKLIYLKKVAKKYNKKVFALYRNKDELRFLNDIGIEFPIASVDTSHLLQKLKKEVDEYKKLI